MKMKKITLIIIGILLVSGLVLAVILPNINIKQELTQEEKLFVWKNCEAKKVTIHNCWWIGECAFCDYSFGDKEICRFRKRMITCNLEEDRKVYNETGSWIDNYTKKDLVKLDIIKLIQARAKTKSEQIEDPEMIFDDTLE